MNKKKTLILCTAIFFAGQFNLNAQCGFGAGLGCSGTYYSNYGYNSAVPATIEYDNCISTFHSTVVRDAEGKLQIWGEYTAAAGNANLTAKTEINTTNFSALTGTPIKAAMGSASVTTNQAIVLTTDGLFVWGKTGTVLANNTALTNQSAVKKIPANATNNINNYGLPGTANTGVMPADVKMMFAAQNTLAIVTCDGQAWVLSQTAGMRGAGSSATSNTTWYRVKANTAGNPDLAGVVAVRGTVNALIALTSDNRVFTWGGETLLGTENTSAQSARNYATEMTLPEAATVKMIGATTRAGGTANATTSYYVLFTNGHLWAMGNNQNGQLGDWTTTASPSSATRRWVQPVYPASGSNSDNSGAQGVAMTDIKWISPNEHDNQNAAINVINNAGRLWNWGTNAGVMLGRTPSSPGTTTSNIDPLKPGQPFSSAAPTGHNNFNPVSSLVLGVETGGHTTMIATECEQNFGYLGHATAGSAGNAVNTNYTTCTYSTAQVDICGAQAAPSVILATVTVLSNNGKVCANQDVTLIGSPAGGTFNVVSGPGILAGNVLSFSATTGTVKISYLVNDVCGPVTAEKDIAIEYCDIRKITGNVWIDRDANAVKNTGENGTNAATSENGSLWANLLDNNGKVVSSVPVGPNGAYETSTLTNGTYSVQITNVQIGKGVSVPPAALVLPSGWAYTGNNKNGVACVVPACTNPNTISNIVVNGADINGNDFGVKGRYALSGNVYHDGDGLSNNLVDGVPIYNPSSAQLFISVLDANGKVVHYVPVTSDGSYTIDIPLKDDAILQITATLPVIAAVSPEPALPAGWVNAGENFGTGNGAGTGVNDGTGTGNNAPATKYDGKIKVTFPNTTTSVTNVNFGIEQPPLALAKAYFVSDAAFTSGTPAGSFPGVPGFRYLPMSSASLVESSNSTNGSLSGSDPEDCASGNCNGNSGGISATFIMGTINTNTRLYYDFGAGGVQPITANTVIPNFDAHKMMIYGQNGQGSNGHELGFTYAIIDKAGNSSPFVSYTIKTTVPLPIRLISFDAYKKGSAVELAWSTASEQKNAGFNIERSINSIDWTKIGFINSKAAGGKSDVNLNYHFTDENPANNRNLYRLAQIDKDGMTNYSPVRIISFQISAAISIYPSPATDVIYIEGLKENDNIKVYDITGRTVIDHLAEKASITLSLDKLNKGIYYVRISNAAGTISSYKVIKQ